MENHPHCFTKSQNNITYSASNVLDGNPNTAWCKGNPGNGIGEYLEFHAKNGTFEYPFNGTCTIQGLLISNGYLKSQQSYQANSRIAKIAVSDCAGGNRTEIDTLVDGNDYRFATARIPGYEIEFIRNTSCFRIEILNTIPGKTNDACISEVALVVNCG